MAKRFKRVIGLAFGIVVVITLVFFYLIVIQGVFDQVLLKKINKKPSFTLRWKERKFLDFKEIEIITDDRYFYSSKVVLDIHPYLNFRGRYPKTLGRMGAMGFLEFQDGYASQGKKIIIKDITARIPLQFIWPDKLYYRGQGYIECREALLNKVIFFKPQDRYNYRSKYNPREGVRRRTIKESCAGKESDYLLEWRKR